MTLLEEYCICTLCGKNHTDGVHKLCDACREARRQYKITHREALSTARKKIYERYKAEGRCVLCGKPAYKGVHCPEHYRKNKLYNDRQPRKGYREAGLCVRCGAEPVPGYKLCEKHLEVMRETQKKGVEVRRDKRNHQKTT